MFVSGPVGTNVTGWRRRSERVGDERDRVVGDRQGASAAGSDGPSRPLSPCTCAATASSRWSGRSAPLRPVRLSRADELEHTERVRGRLLEGLVAVRRRDAEELDLRARERRRSSAIASSWPGSQSRIAGSGAAREYRPCARGRRTRQILAFALSFPETAEDRPWEDDVVVKVRGKIFVFAGPAGSKRGSVKLAESHAHALAIAGAEPTGYGLGKAGWVTVPLRAPGVTSTSCATGSRRAIASSRRSDSSPPSTRSAEDRVDLVSCGQRRLSPKREAASAPAAQRTAERLVVVSSLEERHEETSGEGVACAVPSTTSTAGGVARATSSPSSSRTAPSAPRVTATRPSRRESARSSKRLTTAGQGRPRSGGAGAALRQKRPVHCSHAESTAVSGISS